MNAFIYVRLGLAIAKTSGFVVIPKFNVNWVMKPERELKAWYGKLMGYIRTNKYGVYFALQEVFGVDAANKAVAEKNITKPSGLEPALVAGPSQAGYSRRSGGGELDSN